MKRKKLKLFLFFLFIYTSLPYADNIEHNKYRENIYPEKSSSSKTRIDHNLKQNKHALLIGISDYHNTKYQSLEGPLNDIELVREALIDRFGFEDKNILMVINEQATHTGLKKILFSFANRVTSGDFVYIHYSGHGSFTKDLNGDENRSGLDQTWVSFGARSKAQDNIDIDNFDILDDEINSWVAKIYTKTDRLVFVSDSCHSASVSRGKAPRTRAVPIDTRPHPLGKEKYNTIPPLSVIRIGATRDWESAWEFQSEEEKTYGLFTWHWVKALQNAFPDETWNDIFNRTYCWITSLPGNSQYPQITGNEKNRLIFSGRITPPLKTIPVFKIKDKGSTVYLKAGKLFGVTRGSIYQKHFVKVGERPALVKITRCKGTYSIGKVVEGNVRIGDLMQEQTHVYSFDPIKVYLNGDYSQGKDKYLIEAIKKNINELQEFQIITDQRTCDLILYVLRPIQEADKPVSQGSPRVLPPSDKNIPPEVWILSPIEQLTSEKLKIDFSNQYKGMNDLKENLRKLARIREIKKLGISSNAVLPVQVSLTLLAPDKTCAHGPDCYVALKDNNYRISEPLSISNISDHSMKQFDMMTFTLNNSSEKYYYIYIINIDPNGNIDAIFPRIGELSDSARLNKGESLRLCTEQKFYGLNFNICGKETIKFIASGVPIDVELFKQTGFVRKGSTKLNPLERILDNAMHGKRGKDIPYRSDDWSCMQFEVEVKKR